LSINQEKIIEFPQSYPKLRTFNVLESYPKTQVIEKFIVQIIIIFE
jgi:hypothetical protein